ncbi:MAG: rhodanese-like domain-containing protein [Staphylococcus lugdunensis]|nr:rhodanese-like domain-containing protein [Staphylococcus lugdunensis]
MDSITVEDLKNKVLESNPVNIVDVRTDEETSMGIIPGAETIPMDKIESNIDYFNTQDIHAVNVEGGMKAWGNEGLEIKRI